MDYQQALQYIEEYTDYEKIPVPHILGNYDLRRVEELLVWLGNPHLGSGSVHIAGTNGKGSTAAMIASTLTTAGYRTGLYSSPHLNTIRERFRVDGALITEEEFASVVRRLKPKIERMNQAANYGELTTFELLTALAFIYFKMKKVDLQVLEVGMGGKYDATNVVLPEVSIITSISLDHMEVLGNSLSQIAKEKAGIIKNGGTVVISPQCNEVVSVIKMVCREKNAKLIIVGIDTTWQDSGFDGDKQLLTVKGRLDSYDLAIMLAGKYQLENTATAVAALEVLSEKGYGISRENIVEGLGRVCWAGRLQILSRRPYLVVDGAHNPDAARRLKESLKECFTFERGTLIIGVSTDKDVAGVVAELSNAFDRVIVTRSCHPRAMDPIQLKNEFSKHGVNSEVTDTVLEALSLASSKSGTEDLICVAGSLFVVAEVIEQVLKTDIL
jgi:dihydrofolate synthase/folylpolyglutamate synthase